MPACWRACYTVALVIGWTGVSTVHGHGFLSVRVPQESTYQIPSSHARNATRFRSALTSTTDGIVLAHAPMSKRLCAQLICTWCHEYGAGPGREELVLCGVHGLSKQLLQRDEPQPQRAAVRGRHLRRPGVLNRASVADAASAHTFCCSMPAKVLHTGGAVPASACQVLYIMLPASR